MPWRNILIMLHVVCFPTREPADHLRWGFALVGSEGSFDMKCKPPFDARIADLPETTPCRGPRRDAAHALEVSG